LEASHLAGEEHCMMVQELKVLGLPVGLKNAWVGESGVKRSFLEELPEPCAWGDSQFRERKFD
jgi:hypothetical protein